MRKKSLAEVVMKMKKGKIKIKTITHLKILNSKLIKMLNENIYRDGKFGRELTNDNQFP